MGSFSCCHCRLVCMFIRLVCYVTLQISAGADTPIAPMHSSKSKTDAAVNQQNAQPKLGSERFRTRTVLPTPKRPRRSRRLSIGSN
ncbi:hypothetical protein BCR44DRAFT_1070608 [Catenaria anguillulae PL171]|uniref:Secreted protein n=1 Tax=Catenaria anguillulae PL171 TaxID=765915 RepID=A0A1Y2H692_9FUNG|nr:hypothetical protein BCR44DRAFT_1070608 [Catenaria anguillulae PL171]